MLSSRKCFFHLKWTHLFAISGHMLFVLFVTTSFIARNRESFWAVLSQMAWNPNRAVIFPAMLHALWSFSWPITYFTPHISHEWPSIGHLVIAVRFDRMIAIVYGRYAMIGPRRGAPIIDGNRRWYFLVGRWKEASERAPPKEKFYSI